MQSSKRSIRRKLFKIPHSGSNRGMCSIYLVHRTFLSIRKKKRGSGKLYGIYLYYFVFIFWHCTFLNHDL